MATLQIFAATPGRAQILINEILFNPPGADAGNEYIELRGAPNYRLPEGTYFLSVEGDTNGGPGTVQNVFDLSGQVLGANGMLVLMQKFHSYSPAAFATVLTNSDTGAGYGSGSGSSVEHRGEGGQTDLENPSCTFFLVQAASRPSTGDDIDSDDDGVPDGPVFSGWLVHDSVGVLDSDGPGDIAYGSINFRRDTDPGRQAIASGVVVPVPFTPSYVGRAGNSMGSLASAWVASDGLSGSPPVWNLGARVGTTTNTVPTAFASSPLNHLGDANFGASAIPGVAVALTSGGVKVSEDGATGDYTVALTVAPAGAVSVQVTAGPQLRVSANGGSTFGTVATLSLNSTAPRTVIVRALDDNVVDASPHFSFIAHAVTVTADPANYPLTSLIPEVRVGIVENDSVLLTEVKVNPPGMDEPYEFVEINGPPGALLSNIYLLGIDGSNDPGVADLVVNLSGRTLGSSGLLVVVGSGHPYAVPAGTAVVAAPQFSAAGGGLDNGSVSILLVGSPEPIIEGTDLDNGDNGLLEGLPADASILDAVAWTDGGGNDIVYGGVDLTQADFTPDAAARFPGSNTPLSAQAWYCGDLAGSSGDSLRFSNGSVSSDFPAGTSLSPGAPNNTAPNFSAVAPLSHVIGDPGNPSVTFTVADLGTSAASLVVTASSSNPAVVPDANISIIAGAGGLRTISLNPVGVGYSDITLNVSDGETTGRTTLRYAASATQRPAAIWLTGSSDASAAHPVDNNWMIVGDDENQSLRLYSRTRSGGPAAAADLNPFLDLIDFYDSGSPREIDIEGSTHVGNRIYWIGSHSHGLAGSAKTNRARLFATDIVRNGANSTLTFLAHYDFLKLDLIDWDERNLHGKGASYYGFARSAEIGVDAKSIDGSGFNIEGLAMAPGSSTVAYLGFRAPLVFTNDRSKALIVPVNNFAALAANGGGPGTAVFGQPIELNLGCRGIRSIEGGPHGYVIVAGPPGPATGSGSSNFRLFTWSGPGSAPEERAADLSEMNAEGIIEYPPGPWIATTPVQILSDNGTNIFYGDGIPAKDLSTRNFKKFRCDWVTMGAVVPSPPVIRSVRLAGNQITLAWCAVEGASYRVQTKTNLSVPGWSDVSGDVLALDAVATKTFSTAASPQRFFQVIRLP